MISLKNTIAIAFVVFLAGIGVQVQAADLNEQKASSETSFRIDTSKTLPAASEFKKPWISPAAVNGYQLKMIGSKFAAVFYPNGLPLAVFDLTLNTLSTTDIILGGFSFGDLSLYKLIKSIAKGKSKARKANDIDSDGQRFMYEEDSIEPWEDSVFNSDYNKVEIAGSNESPGKVRSVVEYMKQTRLTDEWAVKNNVPRIDSKPGVPLQPKTFSLADLQIPESSKDQAQRPFVELANLLYPDENWNDSNISDFIREFEFVYRESDSGYDVVWKRSKASKSKQPKLPGVVGNYISPWSNLVYKANLMQINQYGEALVKYLGYYGIFLDLVLSRVVHGLIERLDYHERQFIGLLEEAERFNYDAGIPPEFLNIMINQAYLSKWTHGKDPNIGNGPGKRKQERASHEGARKKVLKVLDKKKDLSYYEIAGGKFTVASKDNEFAGIYGLTLKPTALFKTVPLHVHAKSSTLKLAGRYIAEAAGFVARTLLPGQIKLGFLTIQIPVTQYEAWIRDQSVLETQIEGELVGLVDEALAGRYSLPLSNEELQYTQKFLRTVQLNPYELSLKEEPSVIKKNLELLEDALAGASITQLFAPEHLIPQVQ